VAMQAYAASKTMHGLLCAHLKDNLPVNTLPENCRNTTCMAGESAIVICTLASSCGA